MNLRDQLTLGLLLYGLSVWLVLAFVRGACRLKTPCGRKETPHVGPKVDQDS